MNSLKLGTGEIASLIEQNDWNRSPLGAPESWPQALQTVASLMLNSKFPMFVAWGSQLGFFYNDAYAAILGQKHPAALGQPFKTIWSEIWSDISPIIDKAMAGESSFFENLPLTILRKGFTEQTWFTFSYSPVYCEAGHVAGVFCTCTETTRQVLAERERKDENDRLRDFFQQAPGIMAILRHANHTFELANTAYYQLVGGRDLVGRSVREALPEVEGQGLFELLDIVYSSGEPYVGRAVPVRLRRQPGGELEQRYVDFVYQPIRDSAGDVSGIFIEGSDVTEAIRANKALQDSEQRLRQLANTIPQLAWMAQPDGYIHWFNDRFFEYTGTSLEQVQGWGWHVVHRPESAAEGVQQYKALIAAGEPFEMTGPIRSASGEYRTFFTKTAPLHDAAGNIVQWFGTNTDIHEIEQAQEELREANRRKDEFLAMLAHELRNPLAPISTAAELLKLPNLAARQVRATSAVISRQVSHMSQLVDDLLDVSRVTRGLVHLQRSQVRISDVIDDAVEQIDHLLTDKQQTLTLSRAETEDKVFGDRTRLVQIFSNILNNATRYTDQQGKIQVDVVLNAEDIEVRIKDTGIGIEPQLLPHIFDLFTQSERSPDRSQGGLGLGLALVKSLVELHGGTVSAKNNETGKGSEFRVSLPRHPT
ncbi:ATP-binding protein [Allohahella marinimesophila]|uniref:histidine kinase n=1 Tax=Allohahella marinimesophila TaxID=1054972 RepID=A0ABP7PG83_9GAMM